MLDKKESLKLVDAFSKLARENALRGMDDGSPRIVKWFRTSRSDGNAHPTIEEARTILSAIIEGTSTSDPTIFLVYLDREDGRFKTIMIASYRIFECAYVMDSGVSAKSPLTVFTDVAARRTSDLICVDLGDLIEKGVFVVEKKGGTPTFAFDIFQTEPYQNIPSSSVVNSETIQSLLAHDDGVLRGVLFNPSRIPCLVMTFFTPFGNTSGFVQPVATFQNRTGECALAKIGTWGLERISPGSTVSIIYPCVFEVGEIEQFFAEATARTNMWLRWPMLLPMNGRGGMGRYPERGNTIFVTDTWFVKSLSSSESKRRDRGEYLKSNICEKRINIVLKKYSGGVPLRVFPHLVETQEDLVIVRPNEKDIRFVGMSFADRNRRLILSVDEKSTTVSVMIKGMSRSRVWMLGVEKTLKTKGLKGLMTATQSAIVNLGDGCLVLTKASADDATKRTIEFSYGDNAEDAVILASPTAFDTLRELNQEAERHNIELVRMLSIDEAITQCRQEVRREADVLTKTVVDDIKKELGAPSDKDVSTVVDTRRVDAYGGITNEFVTEMFSTLGPPGWGIAIVKGHAIWYKHTLRFTNRNSTSGDSTSNVQNKEKPFIRYETTLRGMIMLSRTQKGWLVTTRIWHTGRHPNVGGSGGLCHGSVRGSVLDDGPTATDELVKRNGNLTLKEALKAVNKAAELCAASIETGDSGTGFDNFKLDDIDGRRPIIPIFKYNAFANVSSMSEEDAKGAIKAWGKHDPWILLPPMIADRISHGLKDGWLETGKSSRMNLFDIVPEETFRDPNNVHSIRVYAEHSSSVDLAVNGSYIATVTQSQFESLVANGYIGDNVI